MATIRYLSWNIQTYGPRKYNSNRQNRIDFIGPVIDKTDANLVAIMELAPATADNILDDLCDWLNNRHLGQNWEYTSILENLIMPASHMDLCGALMKISP